MHITIVIVNWNSGSQLAEAVSSISRHHANLVASVVIVDNASTDNSLNQVESRNDLTVTVTIIRNSENRGFAAACNQGAAQADGKYLLFLNPDTLLFENALPTVFAFMEDPAHSQIGICGIQLLDEHGQIQRHCARFPSLTTYLGKATQLNRVFPQFFHNHFMNEFDHASSREVDQVIGAFFFVRRSVFEMLQGFDERFFVYFEELDFSLRAAHAGYHSYYLADAACFHKGGGTSEQVKAHRLFYSLQSRLRYGFKHFTCINAWTLVLITVLFELFSRLIFALTKKSWADAAHLLQAYRMLIVSMPDTLRAGRSVPMLHTNISTDTVP